MVHGLHPVVWTYEIRVTEARIRKQLETEFGRTFKHSALHKTADSVEVWVYLHEGRFQDHKLIEGDVWTTVTVTETPVLLNPPKDWPEGAHATSVNDPMPPVPMLAGMQPLEYERWFAEGGTGVDFTYVMDRSQDRVWLELESTLHPNWEKSTREKFAAPEMPAFVLRDAGERSRLWAVVVRPLQGRPSWSLVRVTRRVEGLAKLDK